jgi:uncharacterized protein
MSMMPTSPGEYRAANGIFYKVARFMAADNPRRANLAQTQLYCICLYKRVRRIMNGLLSGFEWDQGNVAHCQKHGVSRSAIESIFSSPVDVLPDDGHSQTEKRFRAIGRARFGRVVFIVFTIRQRDGRRFIPPAHASRGDREP